MPSQCSLTQPCTNCARRFPQPVCTYPETRSEDRSRVDTSKGIDSAPKLHKSQVPDAPQAPVDRSATYRQEGMSSWDEAHSRFAAFLDLILNAFASIVFHTTWKLLSNTGLVEPHVAPRHRRIRWRNVSSCRTRALPR